MSKLTDVSVVLDGADANQDLHQLIGYMWSLGNTEKDFPSTHCSDLATNFLEKHINNAEKISAN